MKEHSFTSKELFELLVSEAQRPLTGWDFSYLENRFVTAPLDWSYTAELLPYLRKSNSVLDMGTGGGEFFSRLQPYPEKAYVTEAYEPNFPIAKQKLEPLGVEVIKITEDENLPFQDSYFDLIINRHESYSVNEVHRILSEKGIFLTQQVGGTNDDGFRRLFLGDIIGEYHEWNLKFASEELEKGGFRIIKAKESFPTKRYFDIGAVVFYLLAVPWEVPGFTVEKYEDKLFELHETILDKGYIDYNSHRFLMIAKKD